MVVNLGLVSKCARAGFAFSEKKEGHSLRLLADASKTFNPKSKASKPETQQKGLFSLHSSNPKTFFLTGCGGPGGPEADRICQQLLNLKHEHKTKCWEFCRICWSAMILRPCGASNWQNNNIVGIPASGFLSGCHEKLSRGGVFRAEHAPVRTLRTSAQLAW